MVPFGLLFFISILAGLVGSASGIGGGVVLVPVLTLFGVDIKEAIAVSTISVVVLSNSAAPGFIRRHMPNIRTSAFLGLFAVAGSLLGALTTLVSGKPLLFLLCGVVLLSSCVALRKKERTGCPSAPRQDLPSRWLGLEGSYYDHAEERTIAYQGNRAFPAGICMFAAGMISGLLGIGGSALSVFVHEWILGLPTKVSVTTSNLTIGVMALAGANIYLEAGLIHPKLVAPVILGVPLGALVGSKLLVHLRNDVVRWILIGVLTLFGIEMIVQGIGSMG